MRDDLIAETSIAIQQRWNVALRSDRQSDYQILLEALEERITDLLCRRPEKLMNSLYILDIPESRVRAALDATEVKERARRLAAAVLERETEKIATRRKYGRADSPGQTTDQELFEDRSEGHEENR